MRAGQPKLRVPLAAQPERRGPLARVRGRRERGTGHAALLFLHCGADAQPAGIALPVHLRKSISAARVRIRPRPAHPADLRRKLVVEIAIQAVPAHAG